MKDNRKNRKKVKMKLAKGMFSHNGLHKGIKQSLLSIMIEAGNEMSKPGFVMPLIETVVSQEDDKYIVHSEIYRADLDSNSPNPF